MVKVAGKAEVSCCRSSDGSIRLYVRDDASRLNVVELAMTPEQFAHIITGLFTSDVDAEFEHSDAIGLVRVQEERIVQDPSPHSTKSEKVQFLEENCQEEGWILDTYLGAQNSTYTSKAGIACIRYHVYKFVNPKEKS